jgi:DUF1680 family protein
MDDVRLLDGPCRAALIADSNYLLFLNEDSQLYTYRKCAGIPAPGVPLGGWEAPDHQPYPRGAFLGHYLSACALMYASTGDRRLLDRVDSIVGELAKCQAALGHGYLAAFPASVYDDLDVLKEPQAGHPYYITHKVMAGLLDAYRYCGNRQALSMVEQMANYFKARTDKLPEAQMQRILVSQEFGGMPDTMYDLYGLTADPQYLTLAHRFDQASFIDPLAAGRDPLTGLHANTHIPKVLGVARRADVLGSAGDQTTVSHFWDLVAGHRSFVTGGTSRDEHWGYAADHLLNALSDNDEETCVTYNMLKVTRQLIEWTGEEKFAEFYERALFNGILSAQNPGDGQFIYFLPLGSGHTKQWGTPNGSFWCCYGTGVESCAKLGDSVYFHDKDGVYVNLFVPSTLTWPERHVEMTQQTSFPDAGNVVLTLKSASPHQFIVHVRVPAWAGENATVTVNGKPATGHPTPGSYFAISRTWKNGDKIAVTLPMTLHEEALPDASDVAAVLYGPIVLAGVVGPAYAPTAGLGQTYRLDAPLGDPSAWLHAVPGEPLTFKTVGLHEPLTFVPLYKIDRQKYGVYWTFEGSAAKAPATGSSSRQLAMSH